MDFFVLLLIIAGAYILSSIFVDRAKVYIFLAKVRIGDKVSLKSGMVGYFLDMHLYPGKGFHEDEITLSINKEISQIYSEVGNIPYADIDKIFTAKLNEIQCD